MKNPPYNLIVFTGRLQHGKSTGARVLEKKGYKRIRFAEPIKDMLMAIGLTKEQVDGNEKAVPCSLLCGNTPRWGLQSLGTQWGRELIGESIWANITEARIRAVLLTGGKVVIDDCRFDSEAEMLSRLGAVIVRVERDSMQPKRSWFTKILFALGLKREHASEAGVSNRYIDITLKNNGTVEDLNKLVEAVANGSYFVSSQVYDAVLELQTKAA